MQSILNVTSNYYFKYKNSTVEETITSTCILAVTTTLVIIFKITNKIKWSKNTIASVCAKQGSQGFRISSLPCGITPSPDMFPFDKKPEPFTSIQNLVHNQRRAKHNTGIQGLYVGSGFLHLNLLHNVTVVPTTTTKKFDLLGLWFEIFSKIRERKISIQTLSDVHVTRPQIWGSLVRRS